MTSERGHWVDAVTGEITPVPEAPYGWVASPLPEEVALTGSYQPDGRFKFEPLRVKHTPYAIRPVTKEEAENREP